MSSKSRSKSSRSKRKEPEKPQRPGDLQPVDATPKDGSTELVPMILGMITAFVLIFGVFGVGSEKVVNESYDKQQDLRRQELIDAKKADSLDELAVKLAELGGTKTSNFPDALRLCQMRIEVSDEILERGPSGEEMRELAVVEGMMARVKLYGFNLMHGLNLSDAGTGLEAAYSPYLEDKNPKVYRTSIVSRLTHQSFETLESGTDEVDDLVALFEDTMSRFPDDQNVSSMIEAHLSVLVEKEPEYSKVLFSKLRERNPPDSLHPVMESKMLNIADRMALKSEDFDRKFADRWANGKAGRRELSDTVVRLLDNKVVGLFLVRRALAVGHWFERNDFNQQAQGIYDAMIAANGNVAKKYREDAEQYAKDGMVRLSLQGKTIEYRGNDSAGKPLDDAKLKEKIGIVVYWSVDSKESIQYLTKLNESARALSNKPIVIFAVCTDDALPKNITMRKTPMIRIIEPKFESGRNSLLEQCPPGLLPHVMLIDFGGKVDDINAGNPAEVKNEALALLMNRGR